jgi:hypothetical protein
VVSGKCSSSTAEHVAALNAKGIPATPIVASHYDESALIRWGIRPWRDFPGKTLFDISQLGLSTVWSVRSHRFDLPTVAVVGDSIHDFCLYYSLLRLHGHALWIPKWFIENKDAFHDRLRSALSNARELGASDHVDFCVFTSATLSEPDIKQLAESAAKISYAPVSAERLTVSLIAKLTRYPLKVYATGSMEKLSTHQLLDDELPGPFESLKPGIFKTLNPQEHRWIVEVAFRKHRIPRHPALGSFIASGPNLAENSVRASNDGLAYICPGSFVMGTDPDFNLVRPSIRVPDAFDIFRNALVYCGYDCEISDKGR